VKKAEGRRQEAEGSIQMGMGIQPHLNASHLKKWGILAPCYLSVARTQTAVGHKNKPSALCRLPSCTR